MWRVVQASEKQVGEEPSWIQNEVKSTSKTHDILLKEFYLFHFLRRPFYAPEHLFTWGVKWSSGCGKKTTSAYGDT